jgi:hypothetical protein
MFLLSVATWLDIVAISVLTCSTVRFSNGAAEVKAACEATSKETRKDVTGAIFLIEDEASGSEEIYGC